MQYIILLYSLISTPTTLSINKWVLHYPTPGGTPKNSVRSTIEINSKELILRFESTSHKVTALTINRDTEEWGEESFSVVLSFKEDRKEGYYFAVNALNKQTDAKISRYDDMDIKWDARWSSKTEYTDTLWEGEIRLPLGIFGFVPQRDTIWYINLQWTSHTEDGIEIGTYVSIKD